MKDELKRIEEMDACEDAMEWMQDQSDLETAWDTCPQGDWMLWLIGQFVGDPGSPSRRKLACTAAECAELVLPIYEAKYPGDGRVRNAIEAAKRGNPDECRAAARAAAAAAAGGGAGAAAAAAAAAGGAARAARAAARAGAGGAGGAAAAAAGGAARAARAAARAAAAAAGAHKKTLAKCADIVRKNYSYADVRGMAGVEL